MSLIEHLIKFRNGPSPVRKQLSLAFAAYAGNFERGKEDVVQEVCTTLGANPETIPVLLELLQFLGEEADHVMEEYADVPPEEVHPLVVSARNAAIPVLTFLHQCYSMAEAEPDAGRRASFTASVIACFGRWLRFDAVPMDQLAASPIVLVGHRLRAPRLAPPVSPPLSAAAAPPPPSRGRASPLSPLSACRPFTAAPPAPCPDPDLAPPCEAR